MTPSLKLPLGAVLWAALFLQPPTLLAQGTAFTYAGRLDQGGSPYTGPAEFQPTLWDAASGGTLVAPNSPAQVLVSVTNGLFTLPLDFGDNFPGADRWLQLEVRAAVGPFTVLSPRQKLTPTPYAITAAHLSGTLSAAQLTGTLPGASLAGTYPGAVTLSHPANSFTGTFTGNGAGLTGLDAGALASGTVPDARLGANLSRLGASIETGELADGAVTSTKLANDAVTSAKIADGAVTTAKIADGTLVNADLSPTAAIADTKLATIASPGKVANAATTGTRTNTPNTLVLRDAAGDFAAGTITATAFVGGGAGLTGLDAGALVSGTVPDARLGANVARANQVWLLGGNAGTTPGLHFLGTSDPRPLEFRVERTHALRLTPTISTPNIIGGDAANSFSNGVVGAFIGGGGSTFLPNSVGADRAAVLGGANNRADGEFSVAMGLGARAAGFASTAGGRDTLAAGNYSVALGLQAKANHDGSFVWADATFADFASTAPNQFSLRAAGGVRLETGGAGVTVDGLPLLLGAAPNQPLEFVLNSASAWRLVPNGTSPNIIGGYSGNIVSNGVVGAFIGGGGNASFPNRVGGNYATVSGGENNTASGNSATVSGGANNFASGLFTIVGGGSGNGATSAYATVGGGAGNLAEGSYATVGGGWNNRSANLYASLGGGLGNRGLGRSSTVGGGEFNQAVGEYSTVPGGRDNVASASYTLAAGRRAKANHPGAFVWADQQEADFGSTADNQFSIRAAGGVRLNNDTSLSFGNQTRQMINLWSTGYGIGVQGSAAYFRSDNEFFWYRGGSHSDAFGDAGAGGTQLMRLGNTGNLVIAGTLSQGSDRAIKQDFAAVNPREILDKVVALPLQTWAYTSDASRRHLGPVAQDFHAAFGLNGDDDKHIATVDADGVALAAIQGLNEKVEVRSAKSEADLRELKAENAALRARLERLERLLETQLAGGAQ
jgi:hypothetical protein